MKRYPHVSEPLTIGPLTLKNRLVMPPMATRMIGTDGKVNDAVRQYYFDRAKGAHLGLMIVEHSYIDIQGRTNPAQFGLAEDGQIPGHRALVEGVHAEGVLIAAQINHGGSYTSPDTTGQEIVSASAIIHPRMEEKGEPAPRSLTVEEIADLTAKYAAAAVRAKEAGYDAVEIHSAHGYLLNQFYSPYTNRRTDEYGGALPNRLRFHREVIRAVRAAVGDHFPIFLRLGGVDYMPGGSTLADCVAAGKLLEQEEIDLLDITGGLSGYVRTDISAPGYFREMSGALKKEISIPVLLTGGVTELDQAEALLADGWADLIGVGRAVLKDAEWARKQWEQGQAPE